MTSGVVTRFAPSPTGFLHIGGARTALFNWLYAQHTGGTMLLRIEDTDRARSTPEAVDAIIDGLTWLGLDWQGEPVSQFARAGRHAEIADQLLAEGHAYRCYASPEELTQMRETARAEGRPPRYDGRWRDRDPSEAPAGVDPVIRIKAPRDGETVVRDQVQGDVRFPNADLDDFVILRSGGTPTYMLAVVVDDHDMGVTHVIRGDDHVTNTGVQMAIFRALGAEPPAFGHHNLLTTASGEGLSKRSGALSIKSLAEAGYEPMAVASLAVLTGSSTAIFAMADMEALTGAFDITATTKSAAKFDPADLDGLNQTLVHDLPFDVVRTRLGDAGVDVDDPRAEAFWVMIRSNVKKVADAADWWPVITDRPAKDAALDGDDLAYARAAFDCLPEGTVDPTLWKRWTEAAKAQSGRKGRALFMPLRIALTGRAWGPDLSDLLPLLGREEILRRRP